MLQITCYGVVCSLFKDNVMKYIGYIEIAVGFGFGLGPGLGGQLYPYLGYQYTNYAFGVLCVIGWVLGFYMIPN